MGSTWGICGRCLEFILGIKPFGTYLGQYWELFKVTEKDNKNSSSKDYHLLEKKLGLPENNNDQYSSLTVDQLIELIKKKLAIPVEVCTRHN